MKNEHRNQPNNNPNSDPAYATQREQRRRAVRNILFAGGSAVVAAQPLGKQWTKPIVDVVTLPAHAATTGDPDPEFSLTDPVAVYTCVPPTAGQFQVNITGSISIPLAFVRVDLVLSWTGSNLSITPPLPTIHVLTQPDGSYSSLDNNIGFGQINQISVVASLPDFPAVTPAEDSIPADWDHGSTGPYYCMVVD